MGGSDQTLPAGDATVVRVQRVENGLVALGILIVVIVAGLPWWVLFAAFLLFDLSAVGYLRDPRLGALTYNAVHNYSGPAILSVVFAALFANGVRAEWLIVLAASWGFHVAVDRALGYGLKGSRFQHTHLGRIGRAKGDAAS